MAKPNYAFAKRQRDLAKKAKKEEKPKPEYEEIAVTLEAARHKPSGTVVLRGARVITMKGDEVLDNADLARIKAVRKGKLRATTLAALFEVERGGAGLQAALDDLCRQASAAIEGGATILVLSDRDADEMIAGLKGLKLLRGFRGGAAADVGAFRQAILRISALVEICPEIEELDVNPLAVLPHGVSALDVRVRVRV